MDAPNADVVNNGTFKSIDIKAIKPNTWKEKASGNSIKITAVDARIVVEAGASLENVTVTQDGGKIKIEAKGDIGAIEIAAPVIIDLAIDGKVGEVAVKAAAVVAVAGTTKEAVPINVTEEAKGADVSSSAPVAVKAEADISLTLSKGAEGSKVESAGDKTQIAVKNDSAENITVKTPAGEQEVTTGTSSKVNSDGTKSETTTTNPGYVYSSPDPLAVTQAIVWSPTEIRVYFNQTVPEAVTTDQVKIVDKNGNLISFTDVERGDPDTHSYWIYLENGILTDGEYTIELTVSGSKYITSFVYEEAVWGPLSAALAIVESEFEKTHTASVSGLKNAELCRFAFEQDLMKAIADSDNDEAKKVSVDVQTRPFDYKEWYPDKAENIPDGHAVVCIWVGLYYGSSATHMTDAFVEFDCSGDAVTVSKPEIVGVTKTSIVIKVNSVYEYALVKEGEDVNSKNTTWYRVQNVYVDELGNVEIDDLDSDATYTVYARIEGLDPVASEQSYKLSEQEDAFVVEKNVDTTLNGKVSYDSENNCLNLEVPFSVFDYFVVYGDQNWAGELNFNDKRDIPGNVCFSAWEDAVAYFTNIEGFGAGQHQFTMSYKLKLGDKEVKSKIFTVKFEITESDLAKI